jgi:hypothetical protein
MNFELVYPMAAMVLLTFVVLVRMFRSRVSDVKSGATMAAFYKTYQEGQETRETAQLSRHFVNLFESPVLFYAACIVGMLVGLHAPLMVTLAWLYVVLRMVHAFIHLGRNKIQPRLRAYFSSWLVLLGMWGTLVFGVATR